MQKLHNVLIVTDVEPARLHNRIFGVFFHIFGVSRNVQQPPRAETAPDVNRNCPEREL